MLAVVPEIWNAVNYVQQGFPSIYNFKFNVGILHYLSLFLVILIYLFLVQGFKRKYGNFFSSEPKGKNGTLSEKY
jgi:hypothetical protein